MTKHILERHIELTACEAFDWTPKIYEQRKDELPNILSALKPQGLPVLAAVLKFLIWILENLLDENGKLSIPIWKWPKVVMAVRDFIKDLKQM